MTDARTHRCTGARRRARVGDVVRPCARALCALGAVCALLLSGCHRFNPGSYTSPESLFRDSMREFRAGRFQRAFAGFQKLTFDLPVRDTLAPRVRFLMAECYFGLRDYVTAAREFRRVADENPTDALAPEALLRTGDSHAQLWRKPELDPTNGQTALAVYQELQGRFPDAPAATAAPARIRALNEDFAAKEYQNALFYFRRGAYDSAILYFKSLIAAYGSTTIAPEAWVKLVRSYHAIGYRDEEQETCSHLRQYYGTRPDVRLACGDGSIRR
ncbi:MAG: outer membrane protein assembly factor BamD [Gemmatimonadota bacterium]